MKKAIPSPSTTLILYIVLTLFSCNRQIKVTGLVTYFFNQNLGQKPDAGAEIYFLPKGNLDLFSFTSQWTFSKFSPKHLANGVKIAQWHNAELQGQIKSKVVMDSILAIQTEESMDRQNAIRYFKSLMKNDQLKCTANGNGEFSIDLPKGRYYVLVIFSHREAITLSLTAEDMEKDTHLNYKFEETDLDL